MLSVERIQSQSALMDPSRNKSSLSIRLASILPRGVSFIYYHISTPPTRCAALYSPPPRKRPEKTYCESHFLNVSIKHEDPAGPQEHLVFAIELLVYTTTNLTTIFVSKADSTGFLSLLQLPRTRSSPLKSIANTFISYLVEQRQRPNVHLVVSLFARAQNQYLFPASIDNGKKHVLDDRQLVRWWCKVLDPVVNRSVPEDEDLDTRDNKVKSRPATTQGYLIVPGLDKNETRYFFPLAPSSPLSHRWKHGHPLVEISCTPTAPPRSLVPHFPDDPKARFLDELDAEIHDINNASPNTATRGTGKWASVKSLAQFWEMMAFRQECSSGRLVGFIWVVVTPPNVKETDEDRREEAASNRLSNPAPSTPKRKSELLSSSQVARAHKRRRTKRLTGPIIPRIPRIKSASSNLSVSSVPENTPFYYWPASSRGEVILEEKEYKRASDLLLNLNFGTQTTAANSTKRWIDEVGVLAGVESWGRAVVGQEESAEASNGATRSGAKMLDMSTLRKKGKPEECEATSRGITPECFDSGLITRPKVESVAKTPGKDVNVLSGNLVRKKQKAREANPPISTVAAPTATTELDGDANMLGGGTRRKNLHTRETHSSSTSAASAATSFSDRHVNVLGGGVVRKKPKVHPSA